MADTQKGSQGARPQPRSVSGCLRLCLGLVGAIGGAVEIPVSVLLNLRTTQCLYTCITLVCCPLLVRQFTMFLLILVTLDTHLQDLLAERHHYDRKVIGKNLPYGGFLSKFYVEDMHNFTYAEIHSSHWGVCAHDTILNPQFLVYVHGMTVFMLPLLCLLAIYLDLLCMKPKKTPFSHKDPPKLDSSRVRSVAMSLSLLVLLCLPVHIIDALMLFTPKTNIPAWGHAVVLFLFQMYSLVPQILFTPPQKQAEEEQASFPLSILNLPPAVAPSRIKSFRMVLCEAAQAAPWSSAKHSLKAKVCPEV
ncbi:Adenosine receptor A2b [Channa argus]|uniref:Adenosine receptor A2b n=1 Tax=Channa argus TaxID=215402 RepID=A0A6G1PPF2_CHAAH|nr:Adenosine receptor A2b [Channa argus]